MKKRLTFLFALLCASMLGWAYTSEPNTWIGTTDATYANQFKWSTVDGVTTPNDVVNIQQPGFATAIGIYVTFPAADFNAVYYNDVQKTNGTDFKIDGAGIVFYLSSLTEQNTEIILKWDETVKYGLNIYNDKGTTGGGGGVVVDDPDPDPEPEGINWASIGWLTNASGNSAYTNKYKAVAGDPGPSNIDVIQNPGWATKPGLYMTFPNADFRNFSLPASCYDIQGAGVIFHMDAFTAKETTVYVNVGGTIRTFTIFYVDGTDEPAEIYDINFALVDNGASATSSNGGTANNAIDNNDGTSWESTHGVDAVTLTVDLGQKRIFNTVQIRWQTAYGKAFTIDVSNDNDTWTTVKTVNETLSGFPYEQNLEFAKTTARYIRFNGTERGTQWGYNMYSFRVLLPGVSTLTSITLNAAVAVAQVGGVGVALTPQPKDQNGQNMEAEVSYEITPAAAGHMSGNTFIPDQAGAASIRAYNGEVYSSAVTIYAYEGSNLALSTNITTDNKVIAQSESFNDAFYAVDTNEGGVWQGAPTDGTADDETSRTYDAWFVLDLGGFYDINLVTIKFEGACSQLYHLDFSEDNDTWNTGYNYVGSAGVNGHTDYLTTLDNNLKVRYVRFWSTKAATSYGMKVYDMKVFGTEWVDSGDTEAPVMTSASLVSSTTTSAIIAVVATDNIGVLKYHVVDVTNGIDANYFESEGNITITGLTHNTTYNFTITAVDAANHESENNIVVAVNTPFDTSLNLALNKTCEGGYYDNNPAESDDKANDGLDNTQWTTYGTHAIELDWWVVDLGQIYNLTNITILWGDQYSTNYILQARVGAPSADDKADDAAWVTMATITDAAANAEKSTNVSGVGRYIRFRALAHTGFMRLKEFRAYASGVAEVDTEKPVMTSASLVSNTDSRAVIRVAATDNVGIASYHVVDAGNSFNANFAADAGNITVTGLTGGTSYSFVITAVDLFGNESANSKSVVVTTVAHLTAPATAATAPTWPAAQVKAIYSPTYNADCNFDAWGSGTVYTQEQYGKKYVIPASGFFGSVGFSLNCLLMEKLHYDIWIADDATIRIVPIWGGAEQGKTVSLTGQQWNSVDLDMATDYSSISDWSNVYQVKIDQAANLTIWIGNAYFYRETEYVDNVAPTNATASLADRGFYSIKITAQAEDNSGAVNFSVRNGETEVATGAAATGVATTITVNGLTPGTAYSFNVVALDERGNAAEPVVVAATTKVVPAPIVPSFNAKDVIPIYTDATTCVISGIQSGGWGESTIPEWLQITPNDQVFYAQNFNWAGWHSWAGGRIDASAMDFLHVDFYSTSMTQVSVTPISPGHEGVYNVTLTPNSWTSADVPLSAYAAANIDWTDIFQFKFMNPVGGNELMIDNVYFFRYAAKASADSWGTFASPVAVKVPAGVTVYKAVYEKNGDDETLTLTDAGSVIPANTGVLLSTADASASYAFTLATSDEATAAASWFTGNSLVGCATRTDISAVAADNDIFCLRRSDLFSMSGFFLYSGQYIPAGKAYLPVPKEDATPAPSRRIRFAYDTTTAIDNVESSAMHGGQKILRNGQLLIRRADGIYTIQGVRVE